MGDYNWGQMQHDSTVVLEGEFTVTIIKAEAVFSSTGKDMIKCTAKIEDGQFAGRSLYTQFTISPESPGAMRMFFTYMNVFGLDNAFFNSIAGQGPGVIASALEGRRAVAVVVKDTWQGVEREKISGWKPALGGHGGGTFVAGLGGNIGAGGIGSSPLGQPSISSYNSPIPNTAAAVSTVGTVTPDAEIAVTAQTPPGEPVDSVAAPSTSPPPLPAF